METTQFLTLILSIFGANFASMLFLTSRIDRSEDKLGARMDRIEYRLDRIDGKLDAHIEWHTKAGA